MKADTRRLLAIAGLVLLVGAALFLRFYRITDPMGGFHAFNEGFYYNHAANDVGRGPLAWLLDPADFNNPPLYTLVLTTVFGVFGPSIGLARAVSVAAGLAAVAVVYLLGRTLYSKRVGLYAAAFTLVVPGFLLVSRNNQVDTLLVALQTASVLAYALAVSRKDTRYAWLGGALLGLALMTKLPAVLIIPSLAIWELWRTRGFGWLRKRRVWAYAAGFLLVGLPWYAVQIARHTQAYLASQAGVGGQAQLMDWATFRVFFASELFWLVSPVGTFVALAGLMLLVRDRTSGDRLVLSMLAVQIVFYLFFHFHTYYLVSFIPFVGLAAGRAFDALHTRAPGLAAAATGVTLAVMLVFAALMVATAKFGAWRPADIRGALGADASDVNLYVERDIADNYGPAVELALADVGQVVTLPAGTVLPAEWTPEPGKREVLVIMGGPLRDRSSGFEPVTLSRVDREVVTLSLIGTSLRQESPRTHFFGATRIVIEPIGDRPAFGYSSVREPAEIYLYDLRTLVP